MLCSLLVLYCITFHSFALLCVGRRERGMGMGCDSPEVVLVMNCARAKLPRNKAVMMVERILMVMVGSNMQMDRYSNRRICSRVGTENGDILQWGMVPARDE